MSTTITESQPEFQAYAKIPRLRRECVITEKIDGTNGQIMVTEGGDVFAGSRNRWLTPEADNFGFAKWVADNKESLLRLGPGRHFGEWYGAGIQRGYGLAEKRFALFNVGRWRDKQVPPACCEVVPVIARGEFTGDLVEAAVDSLRRTGSFAVPGFKNPEGVIVYHVAAGQLFKRLLDNDDMPKGVAEACSSQ